MTEPKAADDDCEHHYESRLLGGHPLHVRLCTLCHKPDWDDLDEQAVELYWWGWQEGRDGKQPRATLSAYDKPPACIHPDGHEGECPCPPSCPCCRAEATASSDTADTPLHRLRGQLAAELAKARHTDEHPRRDLDHLHVTPHNGIAAGLEIALFLVGHHLRETAKPAPARHDDAHREALQRVESSGPRPASRADTGPTVAECAEVDRNWDVEQGGE